MARLEVCLRSPQLLRTCEGKKSFKKKEITQQGSSSSEHLPPFSSFGMVLIPICHHVLHRAARAGLCTQPCLWRGPSPSCGSKGEDIGGTGEKKSFGGVGRG